MMIKKFNKFLAIILICGLMLSSTLVDHLMIIRAIENPVPVLNVNFDNEDARDESKNGLNGTIIGTPEFVDGKSGKAIHLVNSTNRNDAARQYVNFGQPEELKFGEGNFSLMFWYKADASSQTEGAVIGNKYWVSGANPGFTIGDMKNGITLNMNTSGCSRKDTSRYAQATDGTWHHVSAVIDRIDTKTMKLYIDGKMIQSVNISALNGTIDVADFVLGASNKADGTKFLAVDDAYIDELKVYKEVLTDAQVKTLGGIVEPEVKKEMVLAVNFNDENANDISGKNNNGVVVGNPEFVDGINGKAIHLVNSTNRNDAARQYVNFGQPESLKFGEGDFSVMFWYKAEASSQTEGAIIGNKYWVSGANPGFTIGDMKNGVTLNMNTSGCSRKDTSRYSRATDGSWHHVSAVIDRTDTKTMKLYIDGKIMQSVNILALTGTVDVADFVLGASNKADGTKFLAVDDAYIDELFVYNYAISLDDIQVENDKYAAESGLERIEKRIRNLSINERYSKEAIQNMLNIVAQTKIEIKAIGADKAAIMKEFNVEYEKFLEGNPAKMSFHLFSDTHVVASETGTTAVNFKVGLQDMKKVNPNASAVVIAGDITQDGRSTEMATFYKILGEANLVADDQMMIALGNHDMRGPNSSIWNGDPEGMNPYYSTIYEQYMKYNQKYMPETNGAIYYDRWIEGYHFIVLNSENSPKDVAYLSDTQLVWLEEKLAEGDKTTPAFLIVHQALSDTHSGSNTYGGFGKQDAQLKELLAKYPQTVLITGHIHNSFGTIEVMDTEHGTLVDVPTFKSGTGYEVYLYETELYLRARDFVNGEWLPEYDHSIKIPTLPTLCKKIEELNEADYTVESWQKASAALEDVLPEAKAMLNMTYGNYNSEMRSKINVIQEKLDNALKLLKADEEASDVNKLGLQTAIEKADIVTETDLEKVVPAVVSEFRAVLINAKEVYDNSKATQEDVDDAFNRLANVMHMLEFFKGDKGLLVALIKQTEGLNADNYTLETWQKVEEALSNAQAVLENENALQEEVDEAYSNLQAAANGLEEIIKVDKSLLKAMVNKVSGLDENKYIESTWNALLPVLQAAQAALADEKATQEEVDTSFGALTKAYLGLRLKPNKDLLADLINKAEGLNAAGYSAKSWQVMSNALEEAQIVLVDPEATQKEVDNAKDTLAKAFEGLTVDNFTVIKSGDTTSVKTGDDSMTGVFAGLGLLSMAAVVALYKRKED